MDLYSHNSLIFIAVRYSVVHHKLRIHSLVEHFSCLPAFALLNNAVMNSLQCACCFTVA